MKDNSIHILIGKITQKRDDKIISAYKKGESIRMIEAIFGLTKTRIYQVLHKNGVDIVRNSSRVKKTALDKIK